EPGSDAEAPAADAEASAAEPAAPVDELREGILTGLQRNLGEAIVGHEIANGDIWVRVNRDAWRAAGESAKHHGFEYFCFLAGLDWLPSPDLSGEKVWDPDPSVSDGSAGGSAEQTTGIAGGDTRFQVFARLYDVRRHVGVTFKADLDDENPSVDSWVPVFSGADWHERETWEMYGFDFVGHPGLRHLYLPGEFEGHPARKDFPMLAREVKPWPGLVDVEPMPGEDEAPEGEAVEGEAAEGEEAPAE
nr:NADH-quinone oxidoreductase subunit C [Actinomycetota bacterium]